MTHIAFVTSSLSPEMTADDRLAADILEAGGMAVTAHAWDDSRVDWRSFGCVVIRSPWNYHLQAQAFEQWLRRLEAGTVNLWNPAGVILGNMNKRYLVDLAGRGVPIVPTEFLPAAGGRDLRAVLECRGWDDAVVKPAVSLGAHGTWRTSRAAAQVDQARFEAQCQQQDVLLQPCMTEVESEGEWSIVFFGGRYSHAVLKRPAPDDFRVQFHFGGRASAATPPPALIDQAAQVLAAAGSDLLYARVDGVDHNGRFLLMELEVNEPNLFLAYAADAPARFATAIRAVT
jgi:glutathione synthase/RimK-type ligase-like ATP-grasp enzyme